MTPEHYNPEHQQYWYRVIPEETVPEDKRSLATTALRFFAADLKLSGPLPKIIWVRTEDWRVGHEEVSAANWRQLETGEPFRCECFHEPKDFGGYTKFDQRDFIHIRADLEASRVPGTVAHELRHVWQDIGRGFEFRKNQETEAEKDASGYERDAISRFVNA